MYSGKGGGREAAGRTPGRGLLHRKHDLNTRGICRRLEEKTGRRTPSKWAQLCYSLESHQEGGWTQRHLFSSSWGQLAVLITNTPHFSKGCSGSRGHHAGLSGYLPCWLPGLAMQQTLCFEKIRQLILILLLFEPHPSQMTE